MLAHARKVRTNTPVDLATKLAPGTGAQSRLINAGRLFNSESASRVRRRISRNGWPDSSGFPEGSLRRHRRVSPASLADNGHAQHRRCCIPQPRVAVLGYPGCRARPSPIVASNPEGVARCLGVTWSTTGFAIRSASTATPLGLKPIAIRRPKVAEYGNLGLWMQSRWDCS